MMEIKFQNFGNLRLIISICIDHVDYVIVNYDHRNHFVGINYAAPRQGVSVFHPRPIYLKHTAKCLQYAYDIVELLQSMGQGCHSLVEIFGALRNLTNTIVEFENGGDHDTLTDIKEI